jgi:hypothetical protein
MMDIDWTPGPRVRRLWRISRQVRYVARGLGPTRTYLSRAWLDGHPVLDCRPLCVGDILHIQDGASAHSYRVIAIDDTGMRLAPFEPEEAAHA